MSNDKLSVFHSLQRRLGADRLSDLSPDAKLLLAFVLFVFFVLGLTACYTSTHDYLQLP